MPYCTKQNMIDRFGSEELIQLTDRTNAGVIDDTVLNQAIDDASSEIDGYLAGRYALPLATVPTALTRIACNMARYHLYDDAATEAVRQRYEDAVKFLRSVGTGQIDMGLATDGSRPTPSTGAQMESGGRVFGRDDKGFI